MRAAGVPVWLRAEFAWPGAALRPSRLAFPPPCCPCCLPPTPAAAGGGKPAMQLLDGRWRLVFSSGFSGGSLGGRRPGPSLGSLGPLTLGPIFQDISTGEAGARGGSSAWPAELGSACGSVLKRFPRRPWPPLCPPCSLRRARQCGGAAGPLQPCLPAGRGRGCGRAHRHGAPPPHLQYRRLKHRRNLLHRCVCSGRGWLGRHASARSRGTRAGRHAGCTWPGTLRLGHIPLHPLASPLAALHRRHRGAPGGRPGQLAQPGAHSGGAQAARLAAGQSSQGSTPRMG